jgi:hypothetical protein
MALPGEQPGGVAIVFFALGVMARESAAVEGFALTG